MNFDESLFEARIYHGLKCITKKGDKLDPRFLEIIGCEAFGFKHAGDGNFYADGVLNNTQLSVKTRFLRPTDNTRKKNTDFHCSPLDYLGPEHNKKQNERTYGIEIFQRRQALDFDDVNSLPEQIGVSTIEGFLRHMSTSYSKFQTNSTYELVIVHGYDHTNQFYLASLFWKLYQPIDLTKVTWEKKGKLVKGFIEEDGIRYKVFQRSEGNSKRGGTGFTEYKNILNWPSICNISVPVPEQYPFDKDAILSEIKLKKEILCQPIIQPATSISTMMTV